MFIVTGGAGFIGSNLVKALNARGMTDILVVDELTDGHKFSNLAEARLSDYLDRDDFRDRIGVGEDFGFVEGVFHQGACSDTTEWDGRYMMETNFEFSKALLTWCAERKIPFVYASSAAVYGTSTDFREFEGAERPLNVYGWSKWVFDQWLARRHHELESKAVGLRYFNVYGPGEAHKGRMASVVHHFSRQVEETGKVRLFAGSHGYGDGEHRRDFIHVSDIVKLNLWAYESASGGIFNAGTGTDRSFNDVARAVIKWHGRGAIEYIPFPDDLKAAYQAYTKSDATRLVAAGYRHPFVPVEEGVGLTLDGVAKAAGQAIA